MVSFSQIVYKIVTLSLQLFSNISAIQDCFNSLVLKVITNLISKSLFLHFFIILESFARLKGKTALRETILVLNIILQPLKSHKITAVHIYI